MKARFSEKQPPVRWQELGNGKVDVTICTNEQFATEEIPDSEPDTEDYREVFVYDFHQFREDTFRIRKEDIEKHPEKYLEYTPYVPSAAEELEEQLKAQQDTVDMLVECVLELSGIVYA